MLNYFKHVFIVIHRVADGETSELCGESICSGIKKPLLDGLSRILEALVQIRSEAILSFVTRAWLWKAVM
jgi:hypothetical protein